MTEEDFDSFFNSIGFGFPRSSVELGQFEKIYENYDFKSNENNIDPQRILNSLESPKKTVSNVEYHKRTVLAAEIVSRLKNDFSLGHLKLQKLLYLCQNTMRVKIRANFLQQALGPYDPVLMRSIDRQFEQRKWFKFNKHEFPKYSPLEKAGEHRVWFERYFSTEERQISFIIETFRGSTTSDVELVATIFACWVSLIVKQKDVTNENLISAVYNWSEEKSKFSRKEIESSISWMIDRGITPK